jgi:YidC/Oxa1 family membrane protein insertase
MDRRTFLAFVLIFLILAGYPLLVEKFFPQPAPPVGPPPQESTATGNEFGGEGTVGDGSGAEGSAREDGGGLSAGDQTAAISTLPSDATSGGSAAPTTAQEALRFLDGPQEQLVAVATPLYRLRVSTRGGRVVTWEGLRYESWLGGPVQLVPEDISPTGNEALLFRGTDLELGGVVYEADQAAVDVAAGAGPRSLTLKARTAGGLEIRKVLTFDPDTYGIQVDFVLAADAQSATSTLNLTGSPLAFRFGWNQGIAPTERLAKMEIPSMRAVAKIGEELHFKKLQDLHKGGDQASGVWRGSARFAGLQNRYFTVVGVVPREQGEPVEGTIRLSGDKERQSQSWSIDVPVERGAFDELALARLDLYIGPQQAELLQAYGQGLEKSMELGWKLFRPLAEVVLWGMEFMHRFIPNYGVIIIIFSVLTKLMFYPLTKTSTKSMKKMQEIQPKLKALQEKYKNDKDKLNQATMQLYRDEKVNPMAGCLPLLVQSPVFIALYQALSHTITLRRQPFVGWMSDLSQPDAITQLPFALPFLGSDLNVLPILMAAATYVQTKLTPTSGVGGQMAVMNTLMPLFMIFIFYNMPSGLVLYWLVNTIMQGYQTWQIHRTAPGSGGSQTS